jgi:cation transport ATPase
VHHHTHEPEHTTLVHKVFKDPLRDWFAVFLMVLLIGTGTLQWLPGNLSAGMLVCAAIIGIFPILKNAIFDTIASRRPTLELVLGILLVGGLFMGRFLETSWVALFLLIGSFLRLNFSWRND